MNEDIKVLIVDDDSGIRFFLAETLTRVGYTVHEAGNG